MCDRLLDVMQGYSIPIIFETLGPKNGDLLSAPLSEKEKMILPNRKVTTSIKLEYRLGNGAIETNHVFESRDRVTQ
jgi:hypothetical protein